MTAHRLKQIALCTMLIDHIGTLLLPEWTFLRMIGRIAFPLFAFLTAESTFHTHRVSHYLARLLVFACISELPFRWSILNGDPAFGLRNVLFTLLLGAGACCCWAKASAQPLWACAAFLPIAAAELLQTDYGAYGAAVVLLFYALRTHSKIVPCAAFAGLTFFGCLSALHPIQLCAMAAIPLIFWYNGARGSTRGKYFFYAFYPLHLIVLKLLATLL